MCKKLPMFNVIQCNPWLMSNKCEYQNKCNVSREKIGRRKVVVVEQEART